MSIQTEPAQLAEWTALGDFLEEMGQKQSAADFDRSLADWDIGFRRFNDADLYFAGHYEIEEMDLPTHRRCLNALLGMGEQLASWARSGNMSATTEAHIQFGLKILRIIKDEWHHGRSEEELDRIRRVIFGAEA